MRIAIDYTAAARQGGGIGRYARELIGAVLAQESAHQFVLMAASAGLGERWTRERTRLRALAAHPEQLSFRSLPLTDDWMARLWQRLRLPLPAEFLTGRVDCFYSPDFVLPPLLPATRAILTVHDLSFLHHPETFPAPLRRYLETAVPRSIARADHILADSDATHRDLLALLNTPAEKITTLYCGVSPDFSTQATSGERERLQKRYGIGKRPYILTVGTIQPRKNYVRLMAACDPLAAAQALDLVIVGKPAWLAEPILAAADEREYVHRLGFTKDGDLPALYRQAAVCAFPSIYEGFGLPPLEAMACGTPVVASSASSIPEVVGKAGLLINPLDVASWTAALHRVLHETELHAKLRTRGLQHAPTFSWEKSAQKWFQIIGRVCRH